MSATPVSLDALVSGITDGMTLALPPDYSGCAMSAVSALIRRGVRDLHLVGVPSGGLQSDWLIGSGSVATVEAAAMTLGEFGVPPCFARAFKDGAITMLDGTCPAIHAGLQASEKGIPFMPLRGIIGSDLLSHRDDWKVVDNPMADTDGADPIVLIKAIRPDATLFHARYADRDGNVWIGVRRELMLMAHASRRTLVTVEEFVDGNLLADPKMAAGTIPSLYVDAIAVAERGAEPVGLVGAYDADRDAIGAYVSAAKTADGFAAWADAQLGLQTAVV
ncbi:MAG: CoA-transferase [Pseudomonadota bacterium]